MKQFVRQHESSVIIGVTLVLLGLILLVNDHMGLAQVAMMILVCLVTFLLLMYISHRDAKLWEEQSDFLVKGQVPTIEYIKFLKGNYGKQSGRLIDYVFQGLGVVSSNSPIIKDHQSAVAFKRSLILMLRVLILGDEHKLFKQHLEIRLVSRTNDDSGWYYYFDLLSNVNGLLSSLEVADPSDTVKKQRLKDYQDFTQQLVELGKHDQLPLSTVKVQS